jgi:hypothetical protein
MLIRKIYEIEDANCLSSEPPSNVYARQLLRGKNYCDVMTKSVKFFEFIAKLFDKSSDKVYAEISWNSSCGRVENTHRDSW